MPEQTSEELSGRELDKRVAELLDWRVISKKAEDGAILVSVTGQVGGRGGFDIYPPGDEAHEEWAKEHLWEICCPHFSTDPAAALELLALGQKRFRHAGVEYIHPPLGVTDTDERACWVAWFGDPFSPGAHDAACALTIPEAISRAFLAAVEAEKGQAE